MSMHEDDAGQVPMSKDNPCPFLRALVANGFVDGGTVPLPKLGRYHRSGQRQARPCGGGASG